MFPDYAVDHLVVGEGDGSTTEFNIKCPLIKAGSVHVFVGGKEVSPSEFEADCESNCVDTRENYYTAQMTCQDECVKFGDITERNPSSSWYCDPMFWGPFPRSERLYYEYCTIKEASPIWIDLGKPKPCNSLRVDNRAISDSILNKMVIEYSDDNETWTPVEYTMTQQPYSSSSDYYRFYKWCWPLVTARYWRMYSKGNTWYYYLFKDNTLGWRDNTPANYVKGTFFLGKSVPGLKLKNPPAAGETVEVSYKLDVPYKTENNIIRMTFSVALQRG